LLARRAGRQHASIATPAKMPAKDGWQVVPGDHKVLVGGSSHTLPLTDTVKLAGN
jgi:hypothetical protein